MRPNRAAGRSRAPRPERAAPTTALRREARRSCGRAAGRGRVRRGASSRRANVDRVVGREAGPSSSTIRQARSRSVPRAARRGRPGRGGLERVPTRFSSARSSSSSSACTTNGSSSPTRRADDRRMGPLLARERRALRAARGPWRRAPACRGVTKSMKRRTTVSSVSHSSRIERAWPRGLASRGRAPASRA